MKNNKENSYCHDWIYRLESEYHWKLYWNQLNLVMNLSSINKDDKIIEVGVGSGITSMYLRNKGYSVTTLDIDANKNPDIIQDITTGKIPQANAYIAFEVMEHIPYKDACNFVQKLGNAGVSEFIFSLPYAFKSYIWMECTLIKLGNFALNLGTKRKRIISKHHHWELGHNGHEVKSIKKMLSDYNFQLVKDYKYRNHHFFISKKVVNASL